MHFKFCTALYCLLELIEMTVQLMDNILAENTQIYNKLLLLEHTHTLTHTQTHFIQTVLSNNMEMYIRCLV